MPSVLTWDNDAPPAGGPAGPRLHRPDGERVDRLRLLFDPAKMTAGGAAGVVTVDEVADGDALGAANTQQYGFQHGIDVSATSGPFVVHTRLPAPFSGWPRPAGSPSACSSGTGSQDDYVSLAVAANAGAGGFRLVNEQEGVPSTLTAAGPAWPARPSSTCTYVSTRPRDGPGQLRGRRSATGGRQWPAVRPRLVVLGRDCAGGRHHLHVDRAGPGLPRLVGLPRGPARRRGGAPPSATIAVGAPGLNSSTFNSGSFRVTNDSPGGQQIASVRLDLSTSVLPDLVFDPVGVAGDSLGKGFTVDADPGVGTIAHTFGGNHDGGFDALTATFTDFGPGETLTFSADVDPTSIRGSGPPGPGESGSVSASS